MKSKIRLILTKLNLYFPIRAVLKTLIFDKKTWLGFKYLKGQGLEIGALNAPLVHLHWIKVKYLDRLTVPQLRKQYPELATYPLVKVDILDDGETLKNLKNNSQNFIIAHHFLEHCQDPIATIKNHLRVLKKGATLYLAVPDHRFNVDSLIPPTTLTHLINDHQKDLPANRRGQKSSYQSHINNWAYFVDNKRGKSLTNYIKYLININYSIHFHQWTKKELAELFTYLKNDLKLSFEMKEFIFNRKEYLVILKKI